MKGIIYKITNDINDKIYIGKTEEKLNERWSKHIYDAALTNSKNRPLYNAINKYGIQHFFITEIESCNIEELSEREKYWITYYNSYYNGYNATLGGEGISKYNKEAILKLWQEGKTQKEIAEILNCERHTIYRALKSCDISSEDTIKSKYGNRKKEIYMYDLQDNFIKKFNSIADANSYFNKNRKNGLISRVCDKNNRTAYGYKWKS